ncbi:MAG: DUF4091 domain-containing protein [Planctomycetaceae bacterium]|nr:DUF4091 domain-containing protein [Planctomycetaceae bacterium]
MNAGKVEQTIGSIRGANLRDCHEDYEYLYLLQGCLPIGNRNNQHDTNLRLANADVTVE